VKKLVSILVIVLGVGALLLPAGAYYFQGYFVPQVLVSPMRDDVVYTPVGMGIVSSRAGFRLHPVTGKGDFHSGVDLAANLNDKVYNLLDGIVSRVGYRGNLGVAVEIYHPYPNIRTICGHLNGYSVQPGQPVQRGRVIGYAGSTGRSTGVHVHYTVMMEQPKQYIEPMAFLMQVPKYVMALKGARMQAIAAHNVREFKKQPPKAEPTHSEDAELPEEGESECAPPNPDASL
jgi:murein DD-endopeptidase MepM/ murein hydrolase activator NlpD